MKDPSCGAKLSEAVQQVINHTSDYPRVALGSVRYRIRVSWVILVCTHPAVLPTQLWRYHLALLFCRLLRRLPLRLLLTILARAQALLIMLKAGRGRAPCESLHLTQFDASMLTIELTTDVLIVSLQ